MELAIILGLILSALLSLMFAGSRPTTNESDLIDLAAAEKIKDEYLQRFIRNKIMAGRVMRGSSYLTTICLIYISYTQLWS